MMAFFLYFKHPNYLNYQKECSTTSKTSLFVVVVNVFLLKDCLFSEIDVRIAEIEVAVLGTREWPIIISLMKIFQACTSKPDHKEQTLF